MTVTGKPSALASQVPSWDQVKDLSAECDDLIADVNQFVSQNFPQMLQQPAAIINAARPTRDEFVREANQLQGKPPAAEEEIDADEVTSSSAATQQESARAAPTGVMGAVFSHMSQARSAWESYEDNFQSKADEPYDGQGFERYFANGIEDRVNIRLREFDDRNFDKRYYEYHYLEHHLRENDDERLADRMRADERIAEERANERAMMDRESSSYDDERRRELEFERRDDYRMNYEEE